MNFIVLMEFAACVVGLLTIIPLLFKNKFIAGRFLALFLLCISYTLFVKFLLDSGYILSAIHFLRTAPLLAYLIAPFFYLYLLFSLDNSRKFSWKYCLNFLPALVYLIDYFPFLMRSAEYKKTLLQFFALHPGAILQYSEGLLLPPGFHYGAWVFYSLAYIFPASLLLIRHYRKGLSTSITGNNAFPWLITLTALYAFYTITCVLEIMLADVHYMGFINLLGDIIIVFIISILLLFRPQILYDGFFILDKTRAKKQKPVQTSINANLELGDLVKKYLVNKRFLEKTTSLKEVADELQIQPYILSAYINQVYKMHFNDLINKHRIEYIKQELLGNNRDLLTLEAIAGKGGYNNRTTFLSAFKKFTGMTPTAFIRHARGYHLPE